MLRLVPIAMLAVLLGPITAGLAGVALPAFGYAPELGAMHFSFDAFGNALSDPGFGKSLWLGFWLGPATAAIALGLVVLFFAAFTGTRVFSVVAGLMTPVMAVPHAAAAFGLAFLIAPSGFLMRLVSPELTGFMRPPDWLILNDPGGFAMLFGLVVKEIPFLFLMTFSALAQVEAGSRARVTAALGYGRVWGWLTAVLPAVYRQVRFPVYAVIAYATSVVDLAMILGPGTPPPLAVRILHWINDPELTLRLTGAAAALIQLGATLTALVVWWAGERVIARIGRWLALSGRRLTRDGLLRALVFVLTGLAALVVLAGIALLGYWSVAGFWAFPEIMPRSLSGATWASEAPNLIATSGRAAAIGAVTAAIALALVLAALENEYRRDITVSRALWAIYTPLLVPQIAFLGGLTSLFIRLRIDGTFASVVLAHLVFVMPYVYIALADPWNAFDRRYLAIASALGKSPNRAFWTIRLPMMLGPVLGAFALGFAVSVAQYLPTLLVGAGRQPTITTEAVALAAGGNRRLIGAYALVQTLLPFLAFALAGLVPAILWHNRRAMRGQAA